MSCSLQLQLKQNDVTAPPLSSRYRFSSCGVHKTYHCLVCITPRQNDYHGGGERLPRPQSVRSVDCNDILCDNVTLTGAFHSSSKDMQGSPPRMSGGHTTTVFAPCSRCIHQVIEFDNLDTFGPISLLVGNGADNLLHRGNGNDSILLLQYGRYHCVPPRNGRHHPGLHPW